MGYVSINRLTLLIQEKINKLNAGNLSVEELDELKELTTELNERVIVLQYKAAEAQLLRQAGDIISHREPQAMPLAEEKAAELIPPIKISLGEIKTPEIPVAPAVEIPAVKIPGPLNEAPPAEKPVEAVQPTAPQPEPQVTIPAAETQVPKTEVKTPAAEAPAKVSLLERMQKTRISDLKTAIGLNQKFLFMNFLFEGENASYNDAIEKLNNMPTAADARHYIRELAYVYNWNHEDENVILFTEYVERRYL